MAGVVERLSEVELERVVYLWFCRWNSRHPVPRFREYDFTLGLADPMMLTMVSE